jgi:hypothetical protein
MYTRQGYFAGLQSMIAKDLSPYRVFFLHQEQTLRDHEELFCPLYTFWGEFFGGIPS